MNLRTTRLLSWLFFVVAAAADNSTENTCASLSSALPQSVFLPETQTYNASISSYPFIQLRLSPACVVRPKTAQEVSTAIDILRKTGCTKFAVKGGGHNPNVGFNNIEDGVTIDMQAMNNVSIHKGDQVISVGGGALWQHVYDVAETRNLTVLGGRIGLVGVAGFLTGGGIAFFSPERGWSCDAVVNFEIVLASGEIVNANATSRPDLFAALKGGQNNFGIVTRFDLEAFPVRSMWGGRIAFAPAAATDIVSAFTDFKDPKNFDPYAAGWVTFRYNATAKLLTPTVIMWYTKAEQKPGALAKLTSIQPQAMNGMTTAQPAEFARNASVVVKAAQSRTIWATTSFHISPTIVHRIFTYWNSTAPAICAQHANATSELTLQSLPPPPRNGAAPNIMGFSPSATPEKDLVFIQIIFYFTDPSVTDGLNNALKQFIAKFDALAEEEQVASKFRYMNFAAWFQDPIGSYGDDEVAKLRAARRTYDPEGFFQKQLSGFKLF